MAGNYEQLKDIVNNPTQHGLPAWDNDAKEIDGLTIKQYLLSIINSLTVGYQFMGIATPSTNPGTPDQNVFYLASTTGTYTNFDELVLNDGEIAILTYNGNWTKSSLGAFATKSLAGIKKATKLVYCTITIAFNGTSATVTIVPDVSSGYLYHETGYFNVGNTTKTTTLALQNGVNLICYNHTTQNIVLYQSLNEITSNDVLLEAFYTYNALPTFACWTSPMITKTGVTIFNDAYSYQKPYPPLPSIPKSIKRATRTFNGTIKMTLNNDNTITVVVTACYPYSEINNINLVAGTYTLQISNQLDNFIYAATSDKTVKITTNVEDLGKRDILLEAFYTYGGVGTSPFMAMWTSPFIEKTNFPAEYFRGNCSYENPEEIENIKNELSSIKADKLRFSSIRIFQRVGCIGDSYTEGYIHLSGEEPISSNPNYAWPHYMELITGNKWTNWGRSGSTAKGWMMGAANLSQVQAAGNKCQAYIIGLMINDRNNAAWNLYYTPVGVIGDIGTDNDTYYAWYYKLIQAVVTVNPDAKIFCATCPHYAVNDAYNVAVRDIVAYCHNNGQNVYLADYAAEKYRNETFYLNPGFVADYVNGHYTAIGYEFMADCNMVIFSDIINSNTSEFQNSFKIPFDSVN